MSESCKYNQLSFGWLLSYKSECFIYSLGCDVLPKALDVDEAVILGGADELTSYIGLVARKVNDRDIGRDSHGEVSRRGDGRDRDDYA